MGHVGTCTRIDTWSSADNVCRYYYQTKMDQENNVDVDLISEYFEADTTVTRVLEIYSEVYGIRFNRIQGDDADQLSGTGKGSDITMHPDQQLYAVWDKSSEQQDGYGDFKGYIYIDLFVRVSSTIHCLSHRDPQAYVAMIEWQEWRRIRDSNPPRLRPRRRYR